MIACQICLQNFSRKRTLSNLCNPIVIFFLFHSQYISSRALRNYLEQLPKFFKKFMITFVIYLVLFLSKISLNNISIRNLLEKLFLWTLMGDTHCLALCDKSFIYTCFRLVLHLTSALIKSQHCGSEKFSITERYYWICLNFFIIIFREEKRFRKLCKINK